MTIAPVAVTTLSGLVVHGQRWGASPNWAVLVHAPGEDLDAWDDFPARLAASGYAALAIDLPGHGLSDAPVDLASSQSTADAIAAALARAARAGAVRRFPIVAGTSLGPTLAAVRQERGDALVAFSPALDPGDRDLLRDVTIPKLLITRALDRASLAVAEACYRHSIGRTMLSTFAVEAQGTTLLGSPWGDEIVGQVCLFLREFRV